jgi:cytochrome P450
MTETAQPRPTRRPPQVPDHVPDALVRPFPFYVGARTFEHPSSLVAAVHENPPVFWGEMTSVGSAWVPRRMRELRQIYLDTENFSVGGGSHFAGMVGETWVNVPSEIDPPLHTTLRSAINPLFIPRRMAALEDRVRHYARSAIAGFRARGECELMQDFAFEFPIRVFLELMGLPQDDMAQCLAWEHALLHAVSLEQAQEATRGVTRYLRDQIESRRRQPREDFISYGIALEAGGRGLTEDELMGFCFNLFVGGLDTVSTNIGHQFRHLAENPEDQALLRAHPERIGEAIEEFMRAYASSVTPRTCVREVEIGGVTMRPGDRVLMATFLGNRDPEEFADPDKVILDRKPRHVGFGFGPHMCIGMHLANREMRIAIEEFLDQIPPFRIAPGVRVESWLGGMVTPVALPLVW